MKYEILAELYHRFYVPQERSAEKTEIEACHAELSKTLDRSERRLLLKLLDAEDCIRGTQARCRALLPGSGWRGD